MNTYNILLGSGSPRRQQLMSTIFPEFKKIALRDVDETIPEGIAPEQVPQYLSKIKAAAYIDELGDRDILITADTVVILDNTILGKPHSDAEAISMLMRLSGNTHKVVTGVTLATANESYSFSVTTRVHFSHLTEEEIAGYVARCHPLDKAGAYGIQEWIGMVGVKGIEGCFYNVMGLPTAALYSELRRFCDKLKHKA